MRYYLLRGIGVLAVAVFLLASAVLLANASPAHAARSVPQICNDNIVLRGVTLRADKIKGKWLVHAELTFHVYCVPKAGEFDMRLQEFRPSDDEWLTKGPAAKKDLTDTVPGENFSMRRSFECSGDLSWRIRLWISPGIADDGSHWPPETRYFPHKAGRQLDCDAT
jgi:hypothetical protein